MNDVYSATIPETTVGTGGAFIGGRWRVAEGGAEITVRNPATGEPVGRAPLCGRNEARDAVLAAAHAFPLWSQWTGKERGRALLRMADALRHRKPELAHLLTAEQGKPIAEAEAETSLAADYLHWFSEEATRIYGDFLPSPWHGRRLLVLKEPVGVVAAITPWNFPSSMIARKLGPALATGCTIVIKPAEQTPLSALAYGEISEEAGIPPGVVNIVTGDAAAIGEVLIESELVAKVSFTGSTETGRMLAGRCGTALKRMSMELGGNAPLIVFPDADLDRAVEGALAAKYRNAGQTCVCVNRFFVHESIGGEFARRFAGAVAGLRVGPGDGEAVEIGPLIDAAAVAKVEAHVSDAVGKGAAIVTGGNRHRLGGTFFEPTVLTGVTEDMLVTQQETFGPLSAITSFATEEEVIEKANDTRLGLAGYVFTRDLGRVFRMASALKLGLVGVNEGLVTTEAAPFGGVKDSGFGREGSRYGCDDYLNIKYVSIGGL